MWRQFEVKIFGGVKNVSVKFSLVFLYQQNCLYAVIVGSNKQQNISFAQMEFAIGPILCKFKFILFAIGVKCHELLRETTNLFYAVYGLIGWLADRLAS